MCAKFRENQVKTVEERYDTVYLTCSKKLTDSQLSQPHGMNKKCKEKKLKTRMALGRVHVAQKRCSHGSRCCLQ